MSAPRRWCRSQREVPDGAVLCTRRTPYGNPYIIGVHGDRAAVRALFRVYVPSLDLRPLRDRHLVCACPQTAEWCHADDLLVLANPHIFGPFLGSQL